MLLAGDPCRQHQPAMQVISTSPLPPPPVRMLFIFVHRKQGKSKFLCRDISFLSIISARANVHAGEYSKCICSGEHCWISRRVEMEGWLNRWKADFWGQSLGGGIMTNKFLARAQIPPVWWPTLCPLMLFGKFLSYGCLRRSMGRAQDGLDQWGISWWNGHKHSLAEWDKTSYALMRVGSWTNREQLHRVIMFALGCGSCL